MLLLETLQLNSTPRRPVWIMRQAGRYLESFRLLRKKHSFDDLCAQAELAVEASLLPLKQFDFDAAIVFSDILIPLRAMGARVSFEEGGPKIEPPRHLGDFAKLKKLIDPKTDTAVILESLRELRKAVAPEKAVLGFAGAPFTLLTYLLEGQLSKDLSTMKRWMAEEPTLVHEWLENLSQITSLYLQAQIDAGADVVQLFDTWASALSPEDFEVFALPYSRKVVGSLTSPCVYYVNGCAGLLKSMVATGAQALSVDWRISLREVRSKTPHVVAIQGNLDPYHLLLSKKDLREKVFRMCDSYGTGPGHIVNLGHGIVPGIPEASVGSFVDAVREWSGFALNKS